MEDFITAFTENMHIFMKKSNTVAADSYLGYMLTNIILGKKLVKNKDKKKQTQNKDFAQNGEHSHDMSDVRAENPDK